MNVFDENFSAKALVAKIRERLSPRELEVFFPLARGMRMKQVAAMLNISYKTAMSHHSRIMRRLEVNSVAEVAVLAWRVRKELNEKQLTTPISGAIIGATNAPTQSKE